MAVNQRRRRPNQPGPLGLLELRPMRMSLEEIFLSLTTEDAAAAAGTTEGAHV